MISRARSRWGVYQHQPMGILRSVSYFYQSQVVGIGSDTNGICRSLGLDNCGISSISRGCLCFFFTECFFLRFWGFGGGQGKRGKPRNGCSVRIQDANLSTFLYSDHINAFLSLSLSFSLYTHSPWVGHGITRIKHQQQAEFEIQEAAGEIIIYSFKAFSHF